MLFYKLKKKIIKACQSLQLPYFYLVSGPHSLFANSSPLHDRLALFPPGETAAPSQSERPAHSCPITGATGDPPVRFLFDQGAHGQSSTFTYATQT